MNKEEIENKIKEIFFDTGLHIGDGIGDICSGYDEEAMEEAKQKLSTLIQESNREAVEKFRSFCEGEVYEKRLSDEHYVLVSILIDAYLSSIGKEER